MDFAGKETRDARGDAHGFVDAGFEIAGLREEGTGADGFEGGEGGVEVVGESLEGGGVVEEVEDGAGNGGGGSVGA